MSRRLSKSSSTTTVHGTAKVSCEKFHSPSVDCTEELLQIIARSGGHTANFVWARIEHDERLLYYFKRKGECV